MAGTALNDNPHMPTNPQSRWGLRLATFSAWAFAAASVAYWGFKLGAPPPGPAAAVVSSASAPQIDPLKVARLLGATDAPVAAAPVASASSRFTLVGVVAGASRTGTALIAVDGKPAKPFRVGAAVDIGYVLQSVGPRIAVLAPSVNEPAVMTLEMAQPGAAGVAAGVSAPAPARYVAPPAPRVVPPRPPATVPNAPGMSGPASSPSADARRRLQTPSSLRAGANGQVR